MRSEFPDRDDFGESQSLSESELRSRQERLRALQSAWCCLAPFGLSAGKIDIGETGRALSESLIDAASDSGAGPEIGEIDAGLDELEAEMRWLALSVPVDELRSTLPAQVTRDRRTVLDLLDLILGAELAGVPGTQERIPSIDYLITLLCSASTEDGGNLQDPMTLTSRLYGLCLQADDAHDPALAEVEAQFFAAADLQREELHEELSQRTLRQRKAELGTTYFAPPILRAILAYNLTLTERVEEEVATSQDWGVAAGPNAAPETPDEEGVSVFESAALRRLATAVRRRGEGEKHSGSELDRVAWSLDLSFARADERDLLRSESVGHPEDPRGTAILLGVLCRSASVLHDELVSIGLPPERVSGEWLPEIDRALQAEVDRRIAANGYEEACAISELRNRFLQAPITAQRAEMPRPPVATASATDVVPAPERTASPASQARDLAREALEQAISQQHARPQRSSGDWKRRAPLVASVVVLAAVGAFVFRSVVPDAGLAGLDGRRLEAVSPYLTEGARNEEGTGRAFVGAVGEEWAALGEDERLEAAAGLVAALRVQGMDQIMVYDEDGTLRIQALGSAAVKILPPRAAER